MLIVLIWCAALLSVAVGPIDYPGQPSLVVLTVVGSGVVLFLFGYEGGKFLFIRYFSRQARMPPLSRRMLNRIVIAVRYRWNCAGRVRPHDAERGKQ